METVFGTIVFAFALVLIVEGLIYAFFTDAIKRMMALALEMPIPTLRNFGLLMASIGFFLVWLIEKF
ncbi:MAG: DUF2065 domain-containing protein [Pseudomonadota bacterium]